ncbi:MAG: ABC transporter substrate-binding protein [Oscillospiraceae bacterium]|nr:ABC transporter substrate-binding protein [Oscillospiraceae bacterium]
MKRLIPLLLTLLLALTPMAALAEAEGDNVLTVFFTEDPESLEAQMTTEYYAIPLNAFDRLVECVTVDGQPAIVPGLAKSWDVSEDSLTWTFYLNEGVLFHNGEELKADDVVYTVNRMMNPETMAVNTDFFDMIKGAAAFYEDTTGTITEVEGVRALDDYTVEFTLEEPFGPFLANLATPGCSILNRKATEEAGDQFGIDPKLTIGTGPFVIESWDLASEIYLSANQNYFKGAPKIDGVRFLIVPDADTQRMLFENGEADVFDFTYAPSQLEYFRNSEYADQIVSGPEAGLYFYLFNQNIAPLENVLVRKAMQLGLDRQAMLDTLYNGEGKVVNSFIPEGVLGHNPDAEVIEYNPERAKELLAEAGYPDGFELEIIQIADNPAILSMNEIFQYYMSQIGITVNITQSDEASYYARRTEGTLPSYRSVWWADFNDPDNFLYVFFSEKNSITRGSNYPNAEVHAMLEEARTMTDEAERIALYQQAEQIIVHEDAACIPLFQNNHVFCLSERVQNFQIAWNGWSDMSFYAVELSN